MTFTIKFKSFKFADAFIKSEDILGRHLIPEFSNASLIMVRDLYKIWKFICIHGSNSSSIQMKSPKISLLNVKKFIQHCYRCTLQNLKIINNLQ